MPHLQIPTLEVKVKSIYITPSASGEPDNHYVNIELNLEAPNGKKIGEFNIKQAKYEDSNVHPEIMGAIEKLISKCAQFGSLTAQEELTMLEAHVEEHDED